MHTLWYEVVLGRALCKFCATKSFWDTRGASSVVQSSTGKYIICTNLLAQGNAGKCLVQAMWYDLIVGHTTRELCCTN